MAIWTVYAPPEAGAIEDVAPKLRFVRDGFSVVALILPGLWFLWNRLWLAFLGWLAGSAVIALVDRLAGGAYGTAATVAFAILIGLQARDIQRWTLERRGWRFLGVVEGGDRDTAERRFFAAWLAGADTAAPAAPPAAPAVFAPSPPAAARPRVLAPRPASGGVIGLFPTPGGREA